MRHTTVRAHHRRIGYRQYSLGRNPYFTPIEGHHRGIGQRIVPVRQHLRTFNAKKIVREDRLGLGAGLIDPSTLTNKQRKAIIREQDKLATEKQRTRRTREAYRQAEAEGKVW